MPDFFHINLLKKSNPFLAELTKYVMQYLDTAWETNKVLHFLESFRS